MKIVKAIIEGVNLIPPTNEPYKTEKLWIQKITHIYEDGSFDVYMSKMFGIDSELEFFEILEKNCKVQLQIIDKIYKDDYYKTGDFKKACFNMSNDNPYQFPKWTTLN